MKQLKQSLSAFEIAVDENGEKVEKPLGYDDFIKYGEIGFMEEYASVECLDKCKHYFGLTKVIRLPTHGQLIESLLVSNTFRDQAFSFLVDYQKFISQQPKLEDFVPAKDGEALEEPKWNNLKAVEFHILSRQYATAKANVKFFGWKLGVDSEKLTIVYSGMKKIYFYKDCLTSCNGTDIKTYDDLNREVQLLLNIQD